MGQPGGGTGGGAGGGTGLLATWHLDLGLRDSRTVRERVSVVTAAPGN